VVEKRHEIDVDEDESAGWVKKSKVKKNLMTLP
jgi:hypothetical protein